MAFCMDTAKYNLLSKLDVDDADVFIDPAELEGQEPFFSLTNRRGI